MNTNPLLDETWQIKDEMAREAGYDLHQLCENTRKWAAAHGHSGPVIRNAEELRQLADAKEQNRSAAARSLNDLPTGGN
jgi:hypothetical protein